MKLRIANGVDRRRLYVATVIVVALVVFFPRIAFSVDHGNYEEKQKKLRFAAAHNDIGTLKRLLAGGADINGRDHLGDTALTTAASLGHEAAVEFLVNQGASVDLARDSVGESPLMAAARCTGVANSKCKRVVELLLRLGADVNANDTQGESVLHKAIFGGEPEVVSILLKAGADINAQDERGNTALHLTVVRERADLASILVANGASVNVERSDGATALDLALMEGSRKNGGSTHYDESLINLA